MKAAVRSALPLFALTACQSFGQAPNQTCDRNTVSLEEPQLSFSAMVGQSETLDLDVYQDWCAAVKVESLTLTGSNAFAIVPYPSDAGDLLNFGNPYAVGIPIVFTPTNLQPQQATLTIATSSATTPTLEVTITGQGSAGPLCTTDADCTGETSCNGTYCVPGFCAAGLGDGGTGGRGCAPESSACAVDGGWVVVDLTSDPHNCAGCGRACAAGEGCGGGRCGTCVGYQLGPEIDYPLEFSGLADGYGLQVSGMAVGDFDGDGSPDVVLSVASGSSLSAVFFPNDGDGGFVTPGKRISAAQGTMQVGDFNGDCALDVAAAGTLLLGDGRGNFPDRNCALTDSNNAALVADMNGDGIPDLVFGGSDVLTHGAFVALGDGRAGLSALASFGPTFYVLTTGDFNGDGRPDVAGNWYATGDQIGCFLGGGDGGQPTAGAQYTDLLANSTGSFPASMASGDLSGRGHDALVYGEAGTGTLLAIPDPAAGLSGALSLGVDAGVTEVVLGDLDLDGHADVVAAEGRGLWAIGSSRPMFETDGGFALDVWTGLAGPSGAIVSGAFQSVATQTLATQLHVADVNGDGIPDIVAVSPSTSDILPTTARIMVFLGSCQE